MYKNLWTKRLWSKEVVPKKNHFFSQVRVFNGREQFSSENIVLISQKVVVAIHSSMDTLFFRKALAAMNCVYTIHLTDVSI